MPVAINMKRGEKRQEAQKMPNNDEEAIGNMGIVMRPETLDKKPMALCQSCCLLLSVGVHC